MEALVIAVVLSIALASSGVWRALVHLARPAPVRRGRDDSYRRGAATVRKPSLRVKLGPRPKAPRVSEPPRGATRTSGGGAPERSQLRQLAERLSRLESAIDVENVTFSVARSSNGPRGGNTAALGASAPAAAQERELSRAELELMQKMRIGRA